MVYREPADELARQAARAAEASGPLASLDVDGRPGPAGAINIVLERDPGRDHVAHIRGRLASWGGEERLPLESVYESLSVHDNELPPDPPDPSLPPRPFSPASPP